MKDSSQKVRTKTLNFKAKKEEYDFIIENANRLGVSLSDYIRLFCLNTTIDFTVDLPPDVRDGEEHTLLNMYLKPEEHEYLTQKAADLNITLSNFIRIVCTTSKVSFKIDDKAYDAFVQKKWDDYKFLKSEAKKKRKLR